MANEELIRLIRGLRVAKDFLPGAEEVDEQANVRALLDKKVPEDMVGLLVSRETLLNDRSDPNLSEDLQIRASRRLFEVNIQLDQLAKIENIPPILREGLGILNFDRLEGQV